MMPRPAFFHGSLLAAIFALYAAVMCVDIAYAEAADTWRFDEYGPMTTFKAGTSLVAGLLGIAIWRAVPRRSGWTDGLNFWLLAGLGLVWMGVDDYFQVHEWAGRESWNRWQFDPPLFNHTDDLIVALYGVGGLVLVTVYWREVLLGGLSGSLLAGALAAAAVMTMTDAVAAKGSFAAGLEDPANVIASGFFLAAFAVKWRERPTTPAPPIGANTLSVERPA